MQQLKEVERQQNIVNQNKTKRRKRKPIRRNLWKVGFFEKVYMLAEEETNEKVNICMKNN